VRVAGTSWSAQQESTASTYCSSTATTTRATDSLNSIERVSLGQLDPRADGGREDISTTH
jgi:hypothetical protein